MNEEEITYLEKALTNENNENITKVTFKDADKKKKELLYEIGLTSADQKKMLKKLEDYRYVDELPELQEGRYLRWINLTDPENLKLTNGGILCEVKIEESVILVLKNNLNRFFQLNMDESLVFQRYSDQEKVILYAVDYLNETT